MYIQIKHLLAEMGHESRSRLDHQINKGNLPAPDKVLGKLVYTEENASKIREFFKDRKPYDTKISR